MSGQPSLEPSPELALRLCISVGAASWPTLSQCIRCGLQDTCRLNNMIRSRMHIQLVCMATTAETSHATSCANRLSFILMKQSIARSLDGQRMKV